MTSSGFTLIGRGLEMLEDRTVPTAVSSGAQCLVFYLGGVPQSPDLFLEHGTFDPTASHKADLEGGGGIRLG